MNTALYETYVQILHEELVPAMGCTEPIAVAYAGALARQTLGTLPERIELTVSGNIIKNVQERHRACTPAGERAFPSRSRRAYASATPTRS